MRIPLLIAGAAAAGLSLTAPASAAPQILGVVASIAPMPLACSGETCTAQLSAFCLQRQREVPPEKTAYSAADPQAFTLIALRADGSRVRVPVSDQVAFSSAYGYASVRVSVPHALLDQLEAFFTSYNKQRGKKFKITATGGPKKAVKLLKAGMKTFQRKTSSDGANEKRS